MAENLLSTDHEVHSLRDWGDLCEDVKTNLAEIAATMLLSLNQHENVMNAKQVRSLLRCSVIYLAGTMKVAKDSE